MRPDKGRNQGALADPRLTRYKNRPSARPFQRDRQRVFQRLHFELSFNKNVRTPRNDAPNSTVSAPAPRDNSVTIRQLELSRGLNNGSRETVTRSRSSSYSQLARTHADTERLTGSPAGRSSRRAHPVHFGVRPRSANVSLCLATWFSRDDIRASLGIRRFRISTQGLVSNAKASASGLPSRSRTSANARRLHTVFEPRDTQLHRARYQGLIPI